MFSNVPDLITMPGRLLSAPDVTGDKDYTNDLKALKENMKALEENQKLLDQEEEIVEREEQLGKGQKKLKEYENDDLLAIKHDLEDFINKVEIENTMEDSETSNDVSGKQTENDTSMAINSPEASCKARRNWQLARRHLIDKVSLLETTIQRYRTQVASSTATITAKDMVISSLQKETTELRDKLDLKEKKIKKLESQLALSIEDKTRSERKLEMLLEELQNIDLNATVKVLSSPE